MVLVVVKSMAVVVAGQMVRSVEVPGNPVQEKEVVVGMSCLSD